LHDASVGEDGGRRDVAAAVSGEEGYYSRDLLGFGHAAASDGRVQFATSSEF